MTESSRCRRQEQVKTIKEELAIEDGNNRGVPLQGLRYCRLALGVTQRELADMAGVHQSAISALERNTRRAYPKTIRMLCEALKVEPADLVCHYR